MSASTPHSELVGVDWDVTPIPCLRGDCKPLAWCAYCVALHNLDAAVAGLGAAVDIQRARLDELGNLEEQFGALLSLAEGVRDSWLLIEADDAHLMHSCQALDDWLVRHAATSSPAKSPDA